MEASEAPPFPVRHTTACLDIEASLTISPSGQKTDIVISMYSDYVLITATQIGSMGTILHARLADT
ncbi:hypothetical protein M569_14596 [Genlisea aurea]|uniref:Proteasome assembly chaperone 3 n=1 Tax=Genlisea aurea TaxID=192259 RepID=S8C0M9_9LAMI|nr:hypothetical protein M569_14596 [Genlisea aurea]